jgi:predicted nucleic acid-binding protein
LEAKLLSLFGARLLSFDVAAADAYATIRVRAREAGKAIGTADAYIAAIAAAHGLTVASRDTAPFVAAGLKMINPWSSDDTHAS